MKLDFKELFKGILVICSYFLIQVIYCMPFIFLYEKNKISETTLYLIIYAAMAITYLIAYRKTIIEDFKDFKKNYKNILKTTTLCWLLGFIAMLIGSALLAAMNISTAANQEQNINLFRESVILQGITAIILAPIIEELVFRRSFKNFTNNKWMFALVTGLIFGGIHVVSSITSIKDLPMILHIIPYSTVGIALGYAYKEHNNIIGTMILHAFHNILAVIEILLII